MLKSVDDRVVYDVVSANITQRDASEVVAMSPYASGKLRILASLRETLARNLSAVDGF
jgi:hypothetical protein